MYERPGTIHVLVSAALLVGVIVAGGCFDPPQRGGEWGQHDGRGDSAGGGDVGVAVSIPVADAVEPTPVHAPGGGEPSAGTTVTGGGVPPLVWLPWLGWGDTIDLLDLLATGGLAGALESTTENPGSFTHLELLCLDQGLSATYCRSRYGGP